MTEQETVVAPEVAGTETAAVAVEPDVDTTDATDEVDWSKVQEKLRKTNAEARALRERAKVAEEQAKAAEDKAASVDAISRERDELQAQLLRERVARQVGLPDALVDRLRGSTAEEVAADAETLVALIAPKAKQPGRPVEALTPGSGIDTAGPSQLTREALSTMTPKEIERARSEGRFNDLLGIK
jgi:hypothetical protein